MFQEFFLLPCPTLAQNNVISIFSDKYTDVPVNYYNGYWVLTKPPEVNKLL
jgi:hypothetical protein